MPTDERPSPWTALALSELSPLELSLATSPLWWVEAEAARRATPERETVRPGRRVAS